MPAIVLGTRGSLLARTQTGHVADQLRAVGCDVTIEVVQTTGDVKRDAPIASLGREGVFVHELERALKEGRVNAAVHSCKDLPTSDTEGLTVVAIPQRVTPFDMLVTAGSVPLADLPAGAVIGTSSIRRATQLKKLRPDLETAPLRGNIDTRLQRVTSGDYAGIILAAAGLERVGLADRGAELLEPPRFWPAIAQGALAIQIRADDEPLREALALIDDAHSHRAIQAERACLAALAGGCLAPIGGYAREKGNKLELTACVLENTPTGVERIDVTRSVSVEAADAEHAMQAAAELGQQVADELRQAGADAMLERMRNWDGTSWEG
ncbi:hydroxymethylbilane synthase [bacterium]|nr:hydroxymethylbilane synthase [bacterium]